MVEAIKVKVIFKYSLVKVLYEVNVLQYMGKLDV